MTAAVDLDGWAVAAPGGLGIDDALRTLGPDVLGRRLLGYSSERGATICAPPIARLLKRGGVVEAHTARGDVYRLGESVWSRIGRTPKEGSER